MDQSAELARARSMMVDSQIRPNKVTDPRIIDAMRRLPREKFLPPARWALAYADEDVPLGRGRYLMEPMVLARLVQLAAVRAGDRALVVGSGTGYGAALLDALGARVVALEEDAELVTFARPVLDAVAPHVAMVEGRLAAGWPGGAPYDVILVEGAVDAFPADLGRQLQVASGLALAGRLVGVLQPDGLGQGGVAELSAGHLVFQPVFDCATPKLPSLRQPAGFVF